MAVLPWIDRSFVLYRRLAPTMVPLQVAFTLPPLAAGIWAWNQAWHGPPPVRIDAFLRYLALSSLLWFTLAVYLAGHGVQIRLAWRAASGAPGAHLLTPARIVRDGLALLPAVSARCTLALSSLVTLGAALPLARLATAHLPFVALGLSGDRSAPLQAESEDRSPSGGTDLGGPLPGRRHRLAPPPGILAVGLFAWLLLFLLTLNFAPILACILGGPTTEWNVELFRMDAGYTWLMALSAGFVLVEPWRVLALATCLASTEEAP